MRAASANAAVETQDMGLQINKRDGIIIFINSIEHSHQDGKGLMNCQIRHQLIGSNHHQHQGQKYNVETGLPISSCMNHQ